MINISVLNSQKIFSISEYPQRKQRAVCPVYHQIPEEDQPQTNPPTLQYFLLCLLPLEKPGTQEMSFLSL